MRSVHSFRVRACALLVALALSSLTTSASADKFSKLVERLSGHEDFRVRTQAALALGATKSSRAVAPLCKGLGDSSTTVRAASAAALGRLARGGNKCLKRRLKAESSRSVKTVIRKAIARLGRKSPSPAVSISKAKFYVAIGKTTDKTGRKGDQVHQLVRRSMAKAAERAGGFAIAPDDESPQSARKVLARFEKLTPFFLWPKVKEPEYENGDLTIRLEVSIFTYPDKALKGTMQKKLTMPGVEQTDVDSENDLIQMAAAKVFEDFAKNVDRLQ